MHAPDMQEHKAYRYLAIGASIIPLGRKEKRPHFGLLPGTTWKAYQQRRANAREVADWIEHGAENWGLICGVISDRIYCGDVDNMAMARWVLEHKTDPVFRGACIVESGSGKAHVWFRSKTMVRSGTWYLTNSPEHAGDIRGDGSNGAGPSYMVVPPSYHPDGPQYTERAGSWDNLPDVEDGQRFLAAIGDAYLNDNPNVGGRPPASNNMRIRTLTDAEKTDTLKMAQDLNLAKKYADTLFRPGNQTIADGRHWGGLRSNSEIDWWMCRALILKGLDFDAIERVYACALVGPETYKNKHRDHHGYSYLRHTYDNARNHVLNEQRQARVATGGNFTVKRVVRTVLGPKQSTYDIEVSVADPVDPTVAYIKHFEVSNKELTNEVALVEAAFAQTQWIPEFLPSQRGHSFRKFSQAIADMVDEVQYAPRSTTETGHIADVLDSLLKHMVARDLPNSPGEVSMMGWKTGDEYYLRFLEVLRRIKGQIHSADGLKLMHAIDMLGTVVNEPHRYPNGEVESVTRLIPRQQREHLQVLPALPAPSA